MRINHGGSDIAVAEQFLDGADVVIGLQQVARKTVPKRMRRRPLADPRRFHGPLDGFLHMRLVQMITPVFPGCLNISQLPGREKPLPGKLSGRAFVF